MAEASTSPFGEQLRRLREAVGLTQEELAERAGLSRDAISALENGRRRQPHPQTVRALAVGLGLSDRESLALRAAVSTRSGRLASAEIEERPSPLPVPPTPLVGRQRELAELRRLLTGGEARLVTLTGPGGVGKTRLAVELAWDLESAFADGVAFVPLAAVQDPALVLPTIAEVLGVREADGEPLAERVGRALRDRTLLLVLDNLEHVVAAAPSVADLLAACPELTVLATSRASLRLSGEHEYPVSPLAVPGLERPATVAGVATDSAVELFVTRARAAVPAFALTPANATAVAAICRRLDGLPLALELAAARVKVLSPEALLARLDRSSLPLLTGGPRDLPERQRTMEAAIAWSHDLLDPTERALFRQLAVLAGGGPIEAIEALAEASEPGSDAGVLDALERLVDRSLVVVERRPTGDASVRFRLLEPIRAFAAARLEEAGDGEATRDWHASVFLGWAEDIAPELHGGNPSPALRRMDAEHDNLRAALDRLLSHGRVEEAARLLWALWSFWWSRGHYAEGRRWAERVLAERTALSGRSLGRALTVLALMGYGLGRYEELVAPFETGRDLLLRANDDHGVALAVSGLGLTLFRTGEVERGERLLEEGAERLRRVGDDGRAAQILTLLGAIPFNRGDYPRALARFEEGLALAQACADPRALCVSLFDVGLARHALDDLAGAARAYREGLVVAREIGEPIFAAHLVEGLAGLAAAAGDVERAAQLFGGSRAHLAALEVSSAVRAGERAFLERILERTQAVTDERVWAQAWEEGQKLTRDELIVEALGGEVGTA